MGTGILSDTTLTDMTGRVAHVRGDFAEVGVFKGDTFRRLVAAAREQGKTAHAFDSFVGMNDPGPLDDGYPKGYLDVGGGKNFRDLMLAEGLNERDFELWAGYVPDCLEKCAQTVFSLIYVDLDHHDPTAMSIRWAWPRLAPNGILGFDDYFPERPTLASPAIDAFLEEHDGSFEKLHFDNNQLFLRKLEAAENEHT